MWKGSRRALWVFLLRNALLYFLFVHAYLYLREDLSLGLLSAGFVAASALAIGLERLRLRLWVAVPAFLAVALGVRLLLFLVFRLQTLVAAGPETDFLFFRFDRSFFPALLPWTVVWLFNFLALRHPRFPPYEAGALSLLLAAVFWAQGHYRITLYPHPTPLAYALLGFVLLQLLVLILTRPQGEAVGVSEGRRELAALGAFAWLTVPVLLLLLLFLLGRFNEGAVRLGGGLMKPTLFRFDFSEYVRLQSEIEMSDELVLLFRKQGPAEKILLRRYILSGYEPGRGFFHVQDRELEPLPVTVPDAPESFPDPGYSARAPVSQEYFFVNFDPTSLLGMNYPLRVAPLTNWESSSFQRIYRVESRVSTASAEELGSAGGRPLSAAALRHYTQYGGDERLRTLAEEITADLPAREDYHRAAAIRDHLKHGYYYSLKPGIAADGDQLSHFLYESQKGYCSYFAFSMALLCRSLGIPARVAVGFYVDPDAEVLNFYEVRAFQAHAWVEVYLHEYGWIEFDPSSEQVAPGEELSVQFGFDLERLAGLLEEILRNQDRLRESAGAPSEVRRRARAWSGELAGALLWLARLSYLLLPALYLLVLGVIRGLPHLLTGLSRDSRRTVRLRFRIFRRRLRGIGLRRRPQESWLEYGERLEREHGLAARGWVKAYLGAVFAPRFESDAQAAAWQSWRDFVRSYRRRCPAVRRLLGFLNPAALARRRG
ncbi:MAG: transglutaminase domain-containing protein [Spirochaetales bacterium]|nr:transglutaminase domain-containing protein [Spirochaetales bacterium]